MHHWLMDVARLKDDQQSSSQLAEHLLQSRVVDQELALSSLAACLEMLTVGNGSSTDR